MGKVRPRRHCPHCNQSVSYYTFRQHQVRYYNARERKWRIDHSYTNDVYEGIVIINIYIVFILVFIYSIL